MFFVESGTENTERSDNKLKIVSGLMKSFIFVVGLIIFTESLSMAFEMPSKKETLLAIGSTNELPDSFQRALYIDAFERILQSNKIFYFIIILPNIS